MNRWLKTALLLGLIASMVVSAVGCNLGSSETPNLPSKGSPPPMPGGMQKQNPGSSNKGS